MARSELVTFERKMTYTLLSGKVCQWSRVAQINGNKQVAPLNRRIVPETHRFLRRSVRSQSAV